MKTIEKLENKYIRILSIIFIILLMGCKICKTHVEDISYEYSYNPAMLEKYTIQNTNKFFPQINKAYVLSVYDGDTITIAAPVLNTKNNSVYKFSLRVYGIDCPELRSNNVDEKYVAIKAKEFAMEKLLHKHITLENINFDKYGRLLATIFINNENYADIMLMNGFAYEYLGKKKNPPVNWKSFFRNKQNKIIDNNN